MKNANEKLLSLRDKLTMQLMSINYDTKNLEEIEQIKWLTDKILSINKKIKNA